MINTTILRGIVGSTAYGLAREGSDIDRLGIFVTPAHQIASLSWAQSQETNTNSGPGHDDFTEHEVRKYLRLALKANPTITELLWLGSWELQTVYGNLLIEKRSSFLSRHYVHDAYLGYARGQLTKFQAGYKPKHARHTLRLVRQGIELLSTGNLTVKVDNPDEYFAFDNMTPGQALDIITSAILEFDSIEASPLPIEPDYKMASTVLNIIRSAHP